MGGGGHALGPGPQDSAQGHAGAQQAAGTAMMVVTESTVPLTSHCYKVHFPHSFQVKTRKPHQEIYSL